MNSRTEKGEPLGFFMCLPLALLGGMVGAFVGFVSLLIFLGLTSGSNLAGLPAIIFGGPIGAVVGAALGFRTARRL